MFTPASEGARLLAAYLAPHSSPGVVFSRHAQGSGALGLPAVGRCPFVDVTLLLHPDSTQLRSVDHCCATPCEVIVNYSQGRGGEQRAQAESSRELRQVTFPFFSFPNLMLEEGFKELGATESGREREVGFRGFI